jgi:hypothetical protein
MSGRHRRVHVRCGHDIERKLCEAGIAGDYFAFADPAWLGPLAAAGQGPSSRARLIAERCALPVESVRRQLVEAQERLDQLATRYDHVVLWYAHDLYDQASLVRVLASLARRPALPRIELIAIDRFPRVDRFIGLGQLAASQLAALWPGRTPIGRRHLALGARAWTALRAASPQPIEALLASDLSALPLLGAALRRHLQELPWMTDGLALTERLILAGLASGPRTAAALFADTQSRDPQPYMGDLFFWSIVGDLLSAPRPPIAVDDVTRDLAWPRRVIQLTPIGRAVLDGGLDWQAGQPAARWVGGIPVGRDAPDWRWDPHTGKTTKGH